MSGSNRLSVVGHIASVCCGGGESIVTGERVDCGGEFAADITPAPIDWSGEREEAGLLMDVAEGETTIAMVEARCSFGSAGVVIAGMLGLRTTVTSANVSLSKRSADSSMLSSNESDGSVGLNDGETPPDALAAAIAAIADATDAAAYFDADGGDVGVCPSRFLAFNAEDGIDIDGDLNALGLSTRVGVLGVCGV
jgi:hypothetical protein